MGNSVAAQGRNRVFFRIAFSMKAINKLTINSRFLLRSTAVVAGLAGASLAFAQSAQSPFYMGRALGASMTDGNYTSQVQSAGSPRSGYTFNSAQRSGGTEFAGRLFAGYRLNPMFAVELG